MFAESIDLPEKDITEIEAGDYKDIDEYMKEIRQLDIEASYENIHNDYGFIAEVTVNGEKHAVFESKPDDHMVKTVIKPLRDILESESAKTLFKFSHESRKTGCCNYSHMETFWMSENKAKAQLEAVRNTEHDRKPHGICGSCMADMLAEKQFQIQEPENPEVTA